MRMQSIFQLIFWGLQASWWIHYCFPQKLSFPQRISKLEKSSRVPKSTPSQVSPAPCPAPLNIHYKALLLPTPQNLLLEHWRPPPPTHTHRRLSILLSCNCQPLINPGSAQTGRILLDYGRITCTAKDFPNMKGFHWVCQIIWLFTKVSA